MSDLEQIISGETPEPEAVQPVEAEQPQEAQAEAATPEPDAAPAPEEQAPAPDAEPTVPLAVFKSMRDDLKSQLDQIKTQIQPQTPQEPTPEFLDPEGAQFLQTQVQAAVTKQKIEMSRFSLEREVGADAVQEVVEYFDANPQLSQQFINEPSPFHAAKAYVDAQKTAQEIGNDPAAYRQKVEQEVRAQVQAEMAAKQAQEMAAKPAPSMANVNGSGGNTAPGWAGPSDLNALIGE